MQLEIDHDWQGTAEILTAELQYQIHQLDLTVEPPVLRTVRLWRSKKLLSQPKGQRFGFRQVLEGLATTLLLKKGWTFVAIGDVLPTFTDELLEQQILAEAQGKDSSWSPVSSVVQNKNEQDKNTLSLAEDAVILLAQGIIRQYTRSLNKDIVRQDDQMPVELYKAMCKIGRLYIEQGLEDETACIHSVLARSPISTVI